MTYKKIYFILILLTSSIIYPNKTNFNLPFYVTAENGLSIRETPSLDSKKIGVLKHKTKIKVIKVLTDKFETITDNGLQISSNWVLIENPNNPSLASYIYGGYLRQKPYYDDFLIDISKWNDYKIKEQGISIKQPKNWINTTATNKENTYWRADFILITRDTAVDPTQVIIRKKNTSIKKVLKELSSRMWFKKIEEIYLNKKLVFKCTFFFENGCSNVQYLHQKNDRQTTIVEISGTCESHEKGYDETKIIVAESVVFIN